ncbi:MAG: dethiobiotin synthase [Paraperlucidibaca sp.]
MAAFFITGTDTDIGKTYVAVALLHAAAHAGFSTLGLKPVAAGCEATADGLRNADALALQQASSVKLSYEEVNPVALPTACAPHIAAAEAGRRLTINQLAGYCRGSLSQRVDLAVIEGAGGWRVPISEREMLSALPKALGVPVILVVGMRLGALNAAFLTTEAILKDGLRLVGWVANVIDPTMLKLDDNIETLKHWLPAPCLGVLPWAPESAAAVAASHLDLTALGLKARPSSQRSPQ